MISQQVVKEIVETAKIERGEFVLEVGPGRGTLTEALLKTGANVVAVEKDDKLVRYLETKFPKEIALGQLKLVHKDILEFDVTPFIKNLELGIGNYRIVANIPYYITGELLRKFLTAEHQPGAMILMLQKEVAERIVATKGKESVLSLSVKAYGKAEYVRTVKKVCFRPIPKVDSAVLVISSISRNFFAEMVDERFFSLVKQGFAHKRKKLGNNIPNIEDKYKDKRAEELSLGDWAGIARNYKT